MRFDKRFTVLTISLLIWLAACSFGQSDKGSLAGTITETSGALVVGAKVTAINTRTGELRDTTTGKEGEYAIQEVPAGPYTLTVEAPGFSAATTQQVEVAVQQSRRVDVKLQVGQVSQNVTVTAEAPTIQTESAVLQSNVSERQVRELPLEVSAESKGRTPLSFIFLDSNVTAATGGTTGTSASNFNVSGSQGLGQEILLDGSSTRRAQNGTFFTEVAPGPNAYQEFTLSTNSYSAEYGQSTGGVVNFTLKSGGNGFHGEAYDLLQNEAFNANSYINNAQTPRVPRNRDRQNDFGVNLGGPIIKNKAFFFGNYEGYRFSQGETVNLTVPTAKMRTGDFSELFTDPYVLSHLGGPVQIYDPTIPDGPGRLAIPGNRIDLYKGGSIIDPAGLKIINSFPVPTTSGVYHNYRASSSIPTHMNNYVGKGDYVISDRQRFSVSYSYRTAGTTQGGFPRYIAPYVATDVWNQTFVAHFARLQHDFTITPTLLNHVNVGFGRNIVKNMNFGKGITPASLGIPANATNNVAFPYIQFPGYGDPVTGTDPRAILGIGSTFFDDKQADNTYELSDFVSWAKGKHSFKFGGDLRAQRWNVAQFIDPGGHFNFRNDQTSLGGGGGYPLASLITGATEFSFATVNGASPEWRYFTPSFFMNDDYKVTSRLTLNLGLRYEVPNPRTEGKNRYRTFDPAAPNPAVGGRLGALVGAGGQGGQAKEKGLVPTDYSNIGPRLGFAFAWDPKTVIRGGYGLYYAPILYNNGLTDGTQGYSIGTLHTPNGPSACCFLKSYPAAPAVDPTAQLIGNDVQVFNSDFHTGRVQQYSFDLQREFPGNVALQLAYIGHSGRNLRSNFGRPNALPFNDLRLGAPILNMNVNDAANNPTVVAYAKSLGITLPANGNAVFPGFNGNVAQALKAFPQYGTINSVLESRGSDNYNALQVKLDKRFAQGLQFGASYTWSKELTNAGDDLGGGSGRDAVLQNPYNLSSLRAVSPTDANQVFVLNYIYELPFGKGKMFLNDSGWVDRLVGGWQVSGIHRYQAGLPLVIRNSADQYANGFLRLVGINGSIRPNLTGAPILAPNSANGTIYQALNPAAFSSPPVYGAVNGPIGSAAYAAYYADPNKFFGTAPPVIGSARTQPFLSETLSLLKKTRVTEGILVETRAEFFNLLNRHRYNFPNSDLNFADFGASGVVTNFEPRVIQLGLKVIF